MKKLYIIELSCIIHLRNVNYINHRDGLFFPLNFIEFLNCISVILNGTLKGREADNFFKVFKYKNQEIISNSQESHLLEWEQD